MRLLLTNDDGVFANGIYALAKELEKEHTVIVVAPDNQRSACGHSITLEKPLTLKKVNLDGIKSSCYSLNGTPADCVRIGLDRVARGNVDMVISGINCGYNIGTDVIYSGTVSAAIESGFYGIPSIAMSLQYTEKLSDYDIAAKYAREIVKMAEKNYLNKRVILNVNVPCMKEEEIKGIKVCKMGSRIYDNFFTPAYKDENEIHFEIQGSFNTSKEVESDKHYVNQGYVTITPLQYDLTDYDILPEVHKVFEEMR